jgi:3-phosphoinositide dependent protein kinase-1
MDLALQKTLSQSSQLSTASTSSSQSSQRKRNPLDFEFGRILGEGSFSTVLYAEEPAKGRSYAVKILDKRHIVKEKKVKYVTIEKEVLHKLSHPFIVRLYYTFQDAASLYFVLEYCPNGDILSLLRAKGRFSVPGTQFYIGEILQGLAYIHESQILHRDVKPENILLDTKWHIKITDFGSAKMLDQDTPTGPETHKRASFVGTAEYCSPELLNDQRASFASDVWALGCILYQFLVGMTPFKSTNEYQTFQKIIHLEYSIPEVLDPSSKSLIQSILVLDTSKRATMSSIQDSEFFKNFEFTGLENKTPPEMDFQEPLLKFDEVIPEYFDEPNGFDSDFDISKGVNDMTFTSPLHVEGMNTKSSSEASSMEEKGWTPTREANVIKYGAMRKVHLIYLEIPFLFKIKRLGSHTKGIIAIRIEKE